MRVLFIGNSHTYYNDMPQLCRQALKRLGIQAEVTMLSKGGAGLDWHMEQEQTRFNILYGGYDVVVLQHRAHPMGEQADMFAGARRIKAWCDQAGCRVLLYQTWARKGEEAYQAEMSGRYAALGQAMGVPVAPVGDRWQAYRLAHPDVELYDPDGGHASLLGSELAAGVLAEGIAGMRN